MQLLKNFYNQNQRWISLVIWSFLITLIIGAVAAGYYPEIMEEISKSFEEEFGANPALDINLAKDIFIQNLTVSAIAWVGGLLVGLIPFLVVITNGFILGYVVTYIASFSEGGIGTTILFLVYGLLPHGIVEIPAFLLAAVLGLKLGMDWLSPTAKGARLVVLKHSVIYTAKYFIIVVLALALAALIEVFVSGKLVNNL